MRTQATRAVHDAVLDDAHVQKEVHHVPRCALACAPGATNAA
jgi:hypothetical protein